jgi:hypothetical protein
MSGGAMRGDSSFIPPAGFPPGSTFWRLRTDGRIVWVDGDAVARDAIGLLVSIGEVLKEGTRVTERDFRTALVLEGPSSPLRLPSGEFIGGRRLKAARYALPPIVARGDPPWASRSIRIFPVLRRDEGQIGEVSFAWKDGAWHLGRSAFIIDFEERLSNDDCGRLSLAAEERDWATLDAFHALALPWYCRTCGHNYAEESWRVAGRGIGSDDGAVRLHGTVAICPDGHERAIAH